MSHNTNEFVDPVDDTLPIVSQGGLMSQYFKDMLFRLRQRTGGDVDNVNREIHDVDTNSTMRGGEGYLVAVAAVTIELPTRPRIGKPYWFKNQSGGSMTLDGNGKLIEGSATLVSTTADEVIKLVYNGTEHKQF